MGVKALVVRKLLNSLPLIYFSKCNIFLFRLLGFNISWSCRIYSSVKIFGNILVKISDNTFIGNDTVLTGGDFGQIRIGSDCDISDRVSIFCGTHIIDDSPLSKRIAGKGIAKDITIGNGVWIGYGALILPGVSIGDFAVIAAGSVVHKSVPSRTLVGGNPMKIIRNI